jgi:hypothetical protein
MTLQDRPQDQHRQIIVAPSALHSASTLQITATLIGAIFIVSFVLYGINNQRDEGAAPQTTAAAALATPQPANAQQNNQQPAAPSQNAGKPGGPSNPATTGQGGNNAQDNGAQSNKGANTNAGKANPAPANASPNAPAPPKQ